MSSPSLLTRIAHALGKSSCRAKYRELKAKLATADRQKVFEEIRAHNLWSDVESRFPAALERFDDWSLPVAERMAAQFLT